MIFGYKNLKVYCAAKDLVVAVYALLEKFPRHEQYALCDQLRRAVISIPSNIAEGMGRISVKEQVHFLEIAYGSLMEVDCQMSIAVDLNYIEQTDYKDFESKAIDVAKMLSGLRAKRLADQNPINSNL